MFLTVDASKVLGPKYPSARIIINDITAFEKVSEHEYEAQAIVQKSTPAEMQETEEQALDRIKTRFDILTEMTEATQEGTVRAMIVSGPPGVGKSYGVEEQLNKTNIFKQIFQHFSNVSPKPLRNL